MRAEFLFYGRPTYIWVDYFGQQKTITNSEFNVNESNVVETKIPSYIQRDKNIKNFLGDDEFAKFKEAEYANSLVYRSNFDQNLINEEMIYENIFISEFNENFDIEIGYKTILADSAHPSIIGFTPEYSEWLSKIPSELLVG